MTVRSAWTEPPSVWRAAWAVAACFGGVLGPPRRPRAWIPPPPFVRPLDVHLASRGPFRGAGWADNVVSEPRSGGA